MVVAVVAVAAITLEKYPFSTERVRGMNSQTQRIMQGEITVDIQVKWDWFSFFSVALI